MNHKDFLRSLENGEIRVIQKDINQKWKINIEVKQKIIEIFKHSKNIDMGNGFIDKEYLKIRTFKKDDKNIRIVPGGTSIRPGSYIGKNVVVMPPSYINIGAYIDDNTMVDSHVLVGSCAQIGKGVHLSAAVQIGGVLEPIGQIPVIIEDNCFIGAGAIITEGILIRKNAVITPGVVLSSAIPIFDTINEKIYKKEIPENAIVVPGSRALSNSNPWIKSMDIMVNCALIIKYRDQKTETSIELEKALR